MNKKIKNKIKKLVTKSKVLFDEPMCRHTSIRIGGPADVFILIEDLDELKKIVIFSRKKKIPLFVLGGGTNLLVGDRGIRGIVLKLGRKFNWIRFKGTKVLAGASTPVQKLLKVVSEYSLSGLEFISGIPGNIGGAIVTNAGFPEKSIGDFISSVKLMTTTGKIITKERNALQFSYRFSSLKDKNLIILEVVLNNLTIRKKEDIKRRIAILLKKRRSAQPVSSPSAGCIFKNPRIASAGILIDFAGLKGLRIGNAQISTKHANFILNKGHAKFRDVIALIEKIKKRVYEVFRIKLEMEVERVGK